MKPAETLARDRPETNERLQMVTSTITLLNSIYRQNIKSTETLRQASRIVQTTINDSHQKNGLLSWNKRHWIVVNNYRHGKNDLLAESSKTNYERTTGQLTI